MARIADSELQRLKEEISMQRLVEAAGIEFKTSGKDWLGRCPFHADDTASLIVTPMKNLWHCFGCGLGGGPIDWVMKIKGVSFRHAVELLRTDPALAAAVSSAASVAPVKHSTVRALPAPVALEADDQALLDQVIDYYRATLKTSPEALAYLQQRGLDHAEAIEHFKLGYANRTLGLRLPAKTRKEGEAIRARLEKLGIYRISGHEHFNGSLIVPVFDAGGHVVEVYGRKLHDDLRSGTPKHLYLPGSHKGLWNRAALQSREVIVCEALLDALTFWCAGYRNVTASYGVEGFSAEMLAAFNTHGVERVLLAFDRDAAGERGADKLAQRLIAAGIGCWRIQFPKGMDANDYALKVTPASKSLGILIRQAEWLGHGKPPLRGEVAVAIASIGDDARAHASRAADTSNASAASFLAAQKATTATASPLPSLPALVVPPAPALDLAAQVSATEVVLGFGDGDQARRWRVRGLPKNLALGVLKVNVMASLAERFHVDTLDLYAARARATFVALAAAELGVDEVLLKTDLGRVLLKLEQLQDEAIATALEPQPSTVPDMTENERDTALALLRDPQLLERIVADFDACGVVGETTNALVGYLAAVSRKLDRPLAVLIQSSSAAGKSALMDAVLAFVPEEEKVKYSAMTGQSLFYMGETNLQHKILAIAEEEGAARAAYALKLLQSEGELTIASTGSDANGNLITQSYRVEGPTMLLMTTTAIDIDEELLNRCLVLTVDEGRQQTRAIHARQRQQRTLDGLHKKEHQARILAMHRNAQRLLRPLAVVNPYAGELTFLDDRTRTRRDHEKYLTLIDTIALLHQQQRSIKTLTVGERSVAYIEATLADIAQANALAHEVLGRSLDELPPQTRRLLAAIVEYVTAQMQVQRVRRTEVRFSRKELRAALGWGDTQLRVHLERLLALEYLLAHRHGAGGRFLYELIFDGDTQAATHLPGLIDVATLDSAATTAKLRGQPAEVAGRLRADCGPVAGGLRADALTAERAPVRLNVETEAAALKTRALRGNGGVASYVQAASSLAAAVGR